jgi:hypothetical protein
MTGINWRQIDEPLFVRIVDAILDRIWGDWGVAPEGRGGDAGIDYRVDGTRIIYQYKFYPDGGNTASRRRHIKASFVDAMKHNPEEWVLVVPARILPAMRAYVLGLSDQIKITIQDQPRLDNLLAKFDDLAEYFKYRTELDYLHAQAEMLKVNPVFRGPEDVDNKTAALKRAVDASDPDWTFDITARAGEIVRTLVPKHPNAALRSPINIRYTALIPTDSPESRQFEIGHTYGFAEPFKLAGSMVRDFRITGPDLVAYEGAIGELEYHPVQAVLGVIQSCWSPTRMGGTLGPTSHNLASWQVVKKASRSRSRLVTSSGCCFDPQTPNGTLGRSTSPQLTSPDVRSTRSSP